MSDFSARAGTQPGRIDPIIRDDRAIALLLAVGVVVVLTATAPDIGLTWDEPAYVAASESYVAWFGELLARPGYALSPHGIQRYWTPNHEHPPLDKIWSGLVWSVARFAVDDLTAHRLGNILLSGALVALIYLLLAHESGHSAPPLLRWEGRIAGLVAVAATISMPRFWFHAHLSALDVPAAVALLAVVFLFWHARDRSEFKWDLALGLLWGLAMGVKINAIFVPATLFLWMLLFCRRLYLFRRLVVMGLLGVLPFLVLWPWLYHETLPRLAEYALFVTVDHWEIGQWYLGRFYMPPPWHFPFVITLAVVPLSLTILCLLGVARTAVDARIRALGELLILCALVPMLAPAIGQSMVYDNDRLFMPAFPYLAALAGLGFAWVIQGLSSRDLPIALIPHLDVGDPSRAAVAVRGISGRARTTQSVLFTTILAGIVFLPHTVRAATLYPHLLSYYSEAIGGLPGAVRLGLENTYWCETYAAALAYLNAHVQPGDVVWVEGYSHDVMIYYQLHGRLEPCVYIPMARYARTAFGEENVPWMSPADPATCPALVGWSPVKRGVSTSIWDADYVVIQHRQTGFDDEIRRFIETQQPAYRLSHQGVPLIEVYAPGQSHLNSLRRNLAPNAYPFCSVCSMPEAASRIGGTGAPWRPSLRCARDRLVGWLSLTTRGISAALRRFPPNPLHIGRHSVRTYEKGKEPVLSEELDKQRAFVSGARPGGVEPVPRIRREASVGPHERLDAIALVYARKQDPLSRSTQRGKGDPVPPTGGNRRGETDARPARGGT